MIRNFHDDAEDLGEAERIHADGNLDQRCFPDLVIVDGEGKRIPNPLFIEKLVMEQHGVPVMMMFLKVTSEVYLLLDHDVATPEQRLAWLTELKNFMAARAIERGLDQMTAFIPTEMEKAFAKRIEEMGFVKSPWQSYTLNLG